MLIKIRDKIRDKKGGFKELMYDNSSIFILLTLVVIIGFAMAAKTIDLGNLVTEAQDKMIDALK